MGKKIVAIGGGTIGEIYHNNIKEPYETGNMDREIIKLCDASRPNLLFLGFADISYSKEYFQLIVDIFYKKYNCNCKHLTFEDLKDEKKVIDSFDWADAFYIGGGNTYTLMKLLKLYGLDERLRESYNQGKVMSGLSAGGICWFSFGNTVNPTGIGRNLIKQECLGLKKMVFAPHCDEINGHFENVENLLRGENMVGISLSNCCAIEIVDDKYRMIQSDATRYKIQPFGIRSFWYNGNYYIEDLKLNDTFEDLGEILLPRPLKNVPVKEDVKRLLKRRSIYFR